MPVAISPLKPDLWPAFEKLFGKQGACYGCWCARFRLPPAARKTNDSRGEKQIIRERIEAGFSRLVERKAGRPLMRYVL